MFVFIHARYMNPLFICLHPYVFPCIRHVSACTHMHPYASVMHPLASFYMYGNSNKKMSKRHKLCLPNHSEKTTRIRSRKENCTQS